jgi:hypothetical protein
MFTMNVPQEAPFLTVQRMPLLEGQDLIIFITPAGQTHGHNPEEQT